MHTPEHERWYEPMALGDAARVPSDVASEVQGCAECTRRLAEWRGAREAVDAAAREQRDVFARAREGGDVPGAERAERALAELALASQRRPRPRKLWLAAAAVIVLAAGAWLAWTPKHEPKIDDVLDGGGGFTTMFVREVNGRIDGFEWRYPSLPLGGYFVVTVRPWRTPSASPILVSEHLRATHWEPSSEQLASLPERFEWQISAFDAGAKPQPASSWLSFPPP